MNKKLKTIIINVIIFSSLLMIIEFGSSILLDLNQYYNTQVTYKENLKSNLPNYKGIYWAKTHFKEFNELPTEYKSYFGWRRTFYKGQTINIDSFGIRKTIQKTNEKLQAPIAIFLGGSTIWGTGVNDENTIPSLFAKKSKKQYTVLNYGESSYSAYQSHQFLQMNIIKGIKPKLIIAYDGVNNSPVHLPNFFSNARENQIISKMKGQDTKFNSYFMRSTKDLISKAKGKFFPTTIESLKEDKIISNKRNTTAAIELLESWLLTLNLSKEVGAEFYCILQPNAFYSKPNIKNIENQLEKNNYKYGYAYYKNILKLIQENTKYSELKENFINLTSVLDNIPNVYIDYCHLSPNGNVIITDFIVNQLENK